MSNLASRLLTAGALIPLLILAVEWSNPLGVWLIVFTATALGLREFYRMTLPTESEAERGVLTAAGLGFAATLYWLSSTAALGALTAVTLGTFLYYLFAYGAIETVTRRWTAALAGMLYVALLLTFVALLKKRGSDGGAWVYITLTCTWFSDTGAYFAGRFIGPLWPRKLYEAVSPKKTIIGALGGMAASFGALALAKSWYLPSLSWADCALVAIPANLLGQTGDLCESLLKRSVGVKDSGALLPGHGGMLDRVDALLFTAPYIYFYTVWGYGRL